MIARTTHRPRRARRRAPWHAWRAEALEDRCLLSSGAEPQAVAGSGQVVVGDFNGDGLPDEAVVGPGISAAVSIRYGNADGTFQAAKDLIPGAPSVAIAAGDFLGNGHTDLAVLRKASGSTPASVLIFTSQGDFEFTLTSAFADLNHPTSIAAGDVSGDSKVSLALTTASGNVEIYGGNGDGTFAPTPLVYPAITAGDHLAVADFDGDGKPDLVVTSQADSKISLLPIQADGSFSAAIATALPVAPTSFALGDFAGSGTLDAATTNAGTNGAPSDTINVSMYQGYYAFLPPATYGVSGVPTAVLAADLRGDGKLDLIVANTNGPTGSISILLGNGDGTFGPARDYTLSAPPVGLGVFPDATHKGALDILAPTAAGAGDRVLDANGDGTFGTLPTDLTQVKGQAIVGVKGLAVPGLQPATFVDTNPSANVGQYTATIDWGDGMTSTGTITDLGTVFQGTGPRIGEQFGISGSHEYIDDSSHTVVVTIAKTDGEMVTATAQATVLDNPFSAKAQTLTATEGQPVQGTFATFTDVALEPPAKLTATIDWGSGIAPTTALVSETSDLFGTTYSVSNSGMPSAALPKPGTYTAAVTIQDSSGFSTTVYDAVNVAEAPLNANGGSTTLQAQAWQPLQNETVATFTDGNPQAQATDFSATIDWGDGTAPSPGTITSTTFPPSTDPNTGATIPGYTLFTVDGDHTYQGQGDHSITVAIDDLTGSATATATTSVHVAPAPLTVRGGSTVYATEGIATSAAVTIDEPGASDPSAFSATIDWGDGTAPASATIGPATSGQSSTFPAYGGHTYTRSGTYTVTVTVHDAQGLTQTAQDMVVVAEGVLHGNGLTTVLQAQAWQPLQGETVATFTDGDPQAQPSDFSATIDWGDHTTPSTGTITATTFPATTDPNTGATVPGYTLFTVTGDHTYTTPGQDTIHVTIAHLTGSATTTGSTAITVSPTPLMVTGGGSFTALQNATTPALILGTIREQGQHDASEFSATVDWGDGTSTTQAAIQPAGSDASSTSFTAIGSHAYAKPGTYTIQVTVHDAQGLSQTTQDTILVRPAAIGLTGHLDPASDSGPSNSDGITNVTQPVYLGTTAPGASVTLYVSPYGSGPMPIGHATADAQGQWSLTTSPLVQGVYTVTATALDATSTISTTIGLPTLTIDTAPPVISGVSISPRTAEATITFQAGPAGFDPAQLMNSANYALSLISANPSRVYSVTDVSITNGAGPNASVAVSLSFGGLRRMRTGQYILSVSPGTVTNLAGNPLDGGFTGVFPTDPGPSGSGFAVKFKTNGNSTTILPVSGPAVSHPRTTRHVVTRHRRGK